MIELPRNTSVIRCETNGESLWYTDSGERCNAIVRICPDSDVAKLPMDFDPRVVGLFSGTVDVRQFMQWFPPVVLREILIAGYRVFRFTPEIAFADEKQVWFKGRNRMLDITDMFDVGPNA